MNWLLNAIIGILALALIVLVIVRVRLKKRLDSIDRQPERPIIDGLVGVTKRGSYSGKVIGGEFTKVYSHQKEK